MSNSGDDGSGGGFWQNDDDGMDVGGRFTSTPGAEGLSGAMEQDFDPRRADGGAPRMRRSVGPKVAGTTYATTIVARRGLGEVTAGTLSPCEKRGEVKNPPLPKPWKQRGGRARSTS